MLLWDFVIPAKNELVLVLLASFRGDLPCSQMEPGRAALGAVVVVGVKLTREEILGEFGVGLVVILTLILWSIH